MSDPTNTSTTSTFTTLEVTPQYAINQINSQLSYFHIPTRIIDTLHLLTPNAVANCLIQLIQKIIVELLPTYDTTKLQHSNSTLTSTLQHYITIIEDLLSISLQHINSQKVVDGNLTHILLLVQIIDAVIQSIVAQRNASGGGSSSIGVVDSTAHEQPSSTVQRSAGQQSTSSSQSEHSLPPTSTNHNEQQLQEDLQYLQQFLHQAKQQLPSHNDNNHNDDQYDESDDEQQADSDDRQQPTNEHELQSMLDALKELTTQLKDIKQQSDDKRHQQHTEQSEEKDADEQRPTTAQPRSRSTARPTTARITQRRPSHTATRRPSTSTLSRSASSLSANRQAKRNSSVRSPVSKLQQTYNRMSSASDRILHLSTSHQNLHNPIYKEAIHHADDKLDADLRRHASRSYQQLLRTLNKSDYTDLQKRAIEEELEKGVALRELAAKGQIQRALQHALKHRSGGKRDDADVEQMFADELRNLKHAIQLKQQKINNEYQRQLEVAKHQMSAYRSDEDLRANAARSEVHKMQREIREIRQTALKQLKEINSPSMWGWTQLNDPKPPRNGKTRLTESSIYVHPSR